MTSNLVKAQEAVARLTSWFAERERAGDWPLYVRGGRLNRTEIAKECEFGRAAWAQNGGLKDALATQESKLANRGLVHSSGDPLSKWPSASSAEVGGVLKHTQAIASQRQTLEKRVKSLEEQNALLRAENRDLSERLRRCALAETHLAQTGRLLPP